VSYASSTAGRVFEIGNFTFPATSPVDIADTPQGVIVRRCGS
jgi:hypothetical protein